MRILFVVDFFLPYAEGQATALRRAGHEVALLCRDHAHEFGGSSQDRANLLHRMELEGIDVFELPGRFLDIGRLPATLAMRRLINAWAPDVVHVHDNYDPHLLAAVAGHPRVITIHDPAPHPGAPAAGRVRNWLALPWRFNARLIVHSERLKDELVQRYPAERIDVVPHGATVRERPLPPPSSPRILFFGKLLAYKGLGVLLETMNHVWEVRPDLELLIAGAGPEADRIPSDPRIRTRIGHVQDREVEELFAAASVVVLPYLQASQSGIGALSVARGIPVVVTSVGALPSLVDNDTCVVPPGDARSLATALLSNIDHDVDRREKLLAATRENLSWDALVEAHISVYDRAIATRTGRPNVVMHPVPLGTRPDGHTQD